ncbi:MAG: glycosyltransferase family 2 protein [Parasporobacterium sp.]|nr:glycosyltransferase family 2 protein [Parasporobacterium sp.]
MSDADKYQISIVIPVYNGAKTLKRCLDSLRLSFGQVKTEILFVNDGSTDETEQMLEQFQKQLGSCVKIIQKKENSGLFSARLSGVEAACGEYIGFLDADDYVSPGYFETLYDLIRKENTDIAVGTIVNQTPDEICYIQTDCERFPYTQETGGESLYSLYWKQAGRCYHWHVVWNKLYRRELWSQQIPFLKENKRRLTMLEDFIFSSAVLSEAETYCVNTSARYFYVESSDASTRNFSDYAQVYRKIEDMEHAFCTVKDFLEEKSSFYPYLSGFSEWKQRYCRVWKRNVLGSELTEDEKKKCLLYLEAIAGQPISDILEEDENYYSNYKLLKVKNLRPRIRNKMKKLFH